MDVRRTSGDMGDAMRPLDCIDMVGSRFTLVARMGQSDADTVLFRTRMDPGKAVPLHSHRDPECFYVLSGAIDVFLLDEQAAWRSVEAGSSLLVADGVKHAVRNSTGDAADLIVATNNRMARFFKEAGRAAPVDAAFAAPTQDDIQRVLRVAAAYGYWNASPAESAAVTGG